MTPRKAQRPRRRRRFAAVLVGFIAFWSSGTAGAQSGDAILKRVDDHYNHLASMQAHYVEKYVGMGLIRTEAGILLLKKPGKMRWSYEVPAGKVFVFDGKYAWFYSPGDSQAQRVSAKQMDDLRTPLRFLLGHTELKKELTKIVVTPDAGGYRIAGIPKGMESRVKQFVLEVSQTGLITAMRVEEVDGATTEFIFTGIQENVPTKPGDFVFTPPPGVAVVDGTNPI